MTKKDFELIADAMRRACTPLQESAASHGQWEHDCEMLANALAFTNERFDRARFLEACGVAS